MKPAKAKQDQRRERLAKALRDNLKKRKGKEQLHPEKAEKPKRPPKN